MPQLQKWFERLWLPAFLLLSVSWLFAPAVHSTEVGRLSVISLYEGLGRSWSWLFRVCDATGGLVLAAGVLYGQMLRRHRLLGILLLCYSVLAMIDAIFAIGCIGQCSTVYYWSHTIHDTESLISPIVLATITVVDIIRRPRLPSQLFLLAQLVMAGVLLSQVAGHQLLMTMQYIYETSVAIWLGWLITGLFARRTLQPRTREWIRRGFGGWALLNGILTLLLAFHVRVYGPLFGLTLAERQPWLAHPNVLTGIAMLYIARHIAYGQRRAAWLLAGVFWLQTMHYALFEPAPILLALNLLSAVVLWAGWQAFDRNTGPLPLTSRLKDVLVICTGVLAAMVILFALAGVSGREKTLQTDFRHIYTSRLHRPLRDTGEERAESRRSRLRLTTNEVVVVTGAFVLWSLFRPSGKQTPTTQNDMLAAEELLARYSNSSEDFFKLWPTDKQYFFAADRNGFIAYKVAGKVAFALADPISPQRRREAMLEQFLAYCRQNGWSACFLPVTGASSELYTAAGLRLVQIGSSAVISVDTFSTETVRDKWWRWQRNRATRTGLVYAASEAPHGPELIRELRELSGAWLGRAGHTEQGFALGYFEESYLQQCRLHLLRDADGRLVAFANQLPTYNDNPQATVDLIRFLPDVDGAMPVLIMHLIEQLAAEKQCRTFDLGFVPLAGLEGPVAAIARRIAAARFSAAGLEQFKGKFKPDWQETFLAYDGDMLDLASVIANLEKVFKV